ncbi:MAG: glycosyltransferase [Actinobacteria bacterium]|nr:glycosyltransferase [Actinomycetota bacterium]
MRWERQHGHTVHLASGIDTVPSEVPEGVILHVLPELRRAVKPFDDARAVRALRHLIHAHGFDVVHTHESKAGVVGRLAAAGRATVVIHSVHMASFGNGYSAPASAAFLAAERLCARFTSYFVTVGNELREYYLAHGVGRRDQYMTIHSPIDVRRYGKVREIRRFERIALRERFNLQPKPPVVVSVGRLEPRKRHDLVLERLAPLLRRGLVQFALAGQGPEFEALRQRCEHLGISRQVRLLGQIPNIDELLGCADLLIHASRVEGVSQVILQGLAAGVPIVATPVHGLAEVMGARVAVVRSDGSDLADAVKHILATPPEPVALKALDPWKPAEVDRRLQILHRKISGPLSTSS